MNGVGAHEVIIETPDHNANLGSLSVGAVLFEGKPPADALASLLERPVKREDR